MPPASCRFSPRCATTPSCAGGHLGADWRCQHGASPWDKVKGLWNVRRVRPCRPIRPSRLPKPRWREPRRGTCPPRCASTVTRPDGPGSVRRAKRAGGSGAVAADGIVWRGQAGYERLRRRLVWNARLPERYPAAIASARTRDEVLAVVALAREHGLRLALRSGGHSWCAAALRDGALVLDLSGLSDLSIDPGARLMTVGPGLTSGALSAALARARPWVPGGPLPRRRPRRLSAGRRPRLERRDLGSGLSQRRCARSGHRRRRGGGRRRGASRRPVAGGTRRRSGLLRGRYIVHHARVRRPRVYRDELLRLCPGAPW